MNVRNRFLAAAAAPFLLAGLLLAGSSAFHAIPAQGEGYKTITFQGTASANSGTFGLTSSSCSLRTGETGSIPCHLSAGGHLDSSGDASGHVTITANGVVINLQVSAFDGCATGSGSEIDTANLGRPVPVTMEGRAFWTPTSSSQFFVCGSLTVYESGLTGFCGKSTT
jgi:hypothetical protein